MAAVIEQARAARAEAHRLRREANVLRVSVREQLRIGAAGVEQGCWQYARSRRLRAVPQPSAWSELPWLQPDDELEGVLFAVPDPVS